MRDVPVNGGGVEIVQDVLEGVQTCLQGVYSKFSLGACVAHYDERERSGTVLHACISGADHPYLPVRHSSRAAACCRQRV